MLRGEEESLAAVRDGLVSVTFEITEVAVRAIVFRVAAEIVGEVFADLLAQVLDPLTRLGDLGIRHRFVIPCLCSDSERGTEWVRVM